MYFRRLSSLNNSVFQSSYLFKNNFRTTNHTSMSKLNFHNRSSAPTKTALNYVISGFVFMVGMTYASVPLYRKFCQQMGLGGSPEIARSTAEKLSDIEIVHDRKIKVIFQGKSQSNLGWSFKPQQKELVVVPGETALAFYTAKNRTDKAITGIATYNILPPEAGKYFNKIQCFCFEEQRLNPHEEVDMPVFFFIDPEYDEDPRLLYVNKIQLSYTFFAAKEGLELPIPNFLK